VLANGAVLPNRSKNPITGQPSPSPDSRRALKVRVEIDPKLSPLLSAGDVLFVYARAAGIKPPVAAIRQTISQWPIDVILDDASSVMRTSPLFSFDAVEIGAHVSRAGEAMARTGDFVARAVATPTDDGAVVQIRISAVLP
jgi:cytochrome c-type biogenesis protein CcmH